MSCLLMTWKRQLSAYQQAIMLTEPFEISRLVDVMITVMLMTVGGDMLILMIIISILSMTGGGDYIADEND